MTTDPTAEPADGGEQRCAAGTHQPESPEPTRRPSPFITGMTAAAGVAVTYGVVQLIITARQVLILIGLAFFLAMSLEPTVSWLIRHRLPRWTAVLSVLVVAVGVVAGFLAAAIPPLITQAGQFAVRVPEYLSSLQDPRTTLGRLDAQFEVHQRVQQLLSGQSATLAQGLLGAGQLLFGVLSGSVVVAVLVVYFLAAMPRILQTLYRLVPAQRRPHAMRIGDEVFDQTGGYLLGNLITSLIAGTTSFIWLVIFGVPFPLLLAVLVALLDLVPVAGTILAGVIVTLVSLTVSVPVALATVAFLVVYRIVEDYLLVPKIIGRAVQVPAAATVVAVLLGAALLGIIGALIAIPVAAVIRLLLRELVQPRLDRA
ncbi:AI-2E family transporter [Saccharopolyspora phatthalungensis]|uniref:Putative PurR-regulated permease PerM n=1 Tax=Saccharopolyspora phatthalungensis TaxID=664693 RepID=A0A840QJT5_9PSEU|nr:AI-2E family transporter [Saccharopolyspora phatthalungensis]MBB5159315.1 putative PurR-regulated permease PerM [Saccharopolyspora phatthalungensis]